MREGFLTQPKKSINHPTKICCENSLLLVQAKSGGRFVEGKCTICSKVYTLSKDEFMGSFNNFINCFKCGAEMQPEIFSDTFLRESYGFSCKECKFEVLFINILSHVNGMNSVYDLTANQAREYIKDQLENYLQSRGIKTNGGNFKCLVRDHQNDHSKPGMNYHRATNKAHCFKCNSNYDIFDLIEAEHGFTKSTDIFKKAYELYGIEIGQAGNYSIPSGTHRPRPRKRTHTAPELKQYDFTDSIKKAHENTEGLEHFKSRGLSNEIIEKYKLGYAENYNDLLKDYPELKTSSKKQQLYNYIFPYLNNDGTCNYFLAEISHRDQIDGYNGKYRKMRSNIVIGDGYTGIHRKSNIEDNGGIYSHPAHLFNERYLKSDSPKFIYICEGIYDALSYETIGSPAIAFIGTAHKRFLKLCQEHKPNTHFIITLDNDGSGKQATERVKDGLEELGIPYTIANPTTTAKDPNEYLQADREAFTQEVQDTLDLIENTDRSRKIVL